LHVEIHFWTPPREAWRGRLDPATHDNDRLPAQAADTADLKQSQVGVWTDGDERRASVEASL
jgi:hypothetical protein